MAKLSLPHAVSSSRKAKLLSSALVLGLLGTWLSGCSASDGAQRGGGGRGGSSSAGSGNQAGSGQHSSGGSSSAGSGNQVGGGDIGDPCTTNEDCTVVAGSECWTTIGGGMAPEITFPGGYCGKACDPNADPADDCGENASCASLSTSGGQSSVRLNMCAVSCSRDEDCRASEGYRCQIIFANMGMCTL